jgi:amidase
MAPEHGDYWHGFVSSFVVTRSVRDSAAMLDAVAGWEPGDPYTAIPKSGPFADAVGSKGRPLKIGLMMRSPKETRECHPDCVSAVETVGRMLESQGHHVEVAHPRGLDRHKETFSGFNTVVASWVAKALNEWSQVLGREIGEGDVERSTLILAERGRAASAPDYLAVIAGLQSWSREMARWWDDDFDLLVTPTLSAPPLPLGSRAREVFSIATFTTQWNVTGQPAISVPLGRSESGLPIGIQLVADAYREDVLFRIAGDLEQATPWTYPSP